MVSDSDADLGLGLGIGLWPLSVSLPLSLRLKPVDGVDVRTRGRSTGWKDGYACWSG